MCGKLTYLVSCVLALALVGAASAELVGHWRLDDGAGTVAVDNTGNGHDGELIGNPEWVEGMYDGGLKFAGNPDKVDIPYSAQLNPEGQFSASVWANVDPAGSGHRSPITARDDYPQRGYIIYCEPGNTWQFWTGSAAGGWNNAAGPAVNLGEWTHLAITYDNGEKRLYVNGEVGGESTDEMALNTDKVLRIGGGATEGDGNYFFVGLIDDVAVFNHAMTQAEVVAAMAGIAPPGLAAKPSPEHEAIDVLRDVVLGWEAGDFAAAHDVYLGTVFDDVNDATRGDDRGVLVSQGQADVSYDPEGLLDFGVTYYWRIDEVNAAPDNTIFKGEVWSFTAEPFSYPIDGVVATSTGAGLAGAENLVNASGLDAADQHSTESSDMWLASPVGDEPLALTFEFDRVYKMHEMVVWNYNVQFELLLGFGVKNATVEYSADGAEWASLGEAELAQGTARADYAANTAVDLQGVPAKYIRLTVNAGFGGTGQYGLSEVRFMYIPAHAREPQPADGAVDVSVATDLAWRVGRDAVSHEVSFGTDPDALATAGVVDVASFTPDVLDLATMYYWAVEEVQDAESWAGSLWSFTTQAYIVVDDFESYTDDDGNRIYQSWVDGYGVDTNGSQVGHLDSPFAEQGIVKSGKQSMPLFYDNSAAAMSEAELALNQDWTASGIKSLTLSFQGDPDNTGGQLYVKINGTKIAYDGVASKLSDASWNLWSIDLAAAGNVGNVTSLIIGVDGAGADGVLYIDDVRLYPEVLAYHRLSDITSADDTVQGVPNDGDWPDAETPALAVDDDVNTKYLHRKGAEVATGIQVAPAAGSTVVTGVTFTSANDDYGRDPTSFELHGSNASIDGPYTLIAAGPIVDFAGEEVWPRFTKTETVITFENTIAYAYYQIVFPTVDRSNNDGLMQIAEIELIGQ